MPLPRTTDFCPICGARLQGRLDKRFCSSACRSQYFRNKNQERLPVSLPIDSILHKNWKILSEFYASIEKKKFFVALSKLSKKGFQPEYFTTAFENAQQKKYFFVYDFGWMMFSEKQVMVIKLDQPK